MGHHAEQRAVLEAAAHIQSKWIHQGKFISVRQDEIDYPNGSHQTWDIVLHLGAAAVLPLTSKGEIILVEQFRRAIGHTMLEIPAGLMDADETPVMCAQRELQEEAGFKAGKLTGLGSYYSSPGVSTEKVHLFLAQELSESRLIADDTHEIDIHIVPWQKALQLVEDGTICDAKTALAILKVGPSCYES